MVHRLVATCQEAHMARRRQGGYQAEPQRSQIEMAVERLSQMPRLSGYQNLAWRLAELALDLPAIHDYPPRSPVSGRVRSLDRLPTEALVLWCRDVFRQNPLAGVVVID